MQLIETDGTPVDLTNATQVKFEWASRGASPKVDAVATVLSATQGSVRYNWAGGDVDTVGGVQRRVGGDLR